jgi:hypothetical protein
MSMRRVLAISALTLLAGGCSTTPPHSPSVLVLPGTGKSFEQFRADNEICKQFAREQVGGQTTDMAATDSGVRSAAVGTILGAAVGAAADGGHGAGVGAGVGLALGGLEGSRAAEVSGGRLQQRFDYGFIQCMYAKGHRVPVARGSLMDDFFQNPPNQHYYPPPPTQSKPIQ